MGKEFIKSALLAVCLLLCAASCSERTPIPRKTMQRIYYDMMLADSYVELSPDFRTASDSMGIYRPLIEKYGYTVEQFLATQAILLKDPESFSRIFEANSKAYHAKAEEMMARIHVRDSLADLQFELEQAERVALDEFLDSISYAKLMDTLVVSFIGDSLVIDTLYTAVDSARLQMHKKRDSSETGGSIFEEPEESRATVEEIDIEFKELDAISSPDQKVKGKEDAKTGKERRRPRLFGGRKKNDGMPGEDKLREIEEKFK